MDARALFYQDSHLCRFTALVTGCHPMPDGWAVSLDRTAFYPEGGGQPWDLGTLGEAQVLAVTEQNGAPVRPGAPGGGRGGRLHRLAPAV